MEGGRKEERKGLCVNPNEKCQSHRRRSGQSLYAKPEEKKESRRVPQPAYRGLDGLTFLKTIGSSPAIKFASIYW